MKDFSLINFFLKLCCFSLAGLLASSGWADTPDYYQKIDWLNGKIQAVGSAFPGKKRSGQPFDPQKMVSVAKVTAQGNLLRQINNLRVSANERVKAVVGSDPFFMAKVQELVKNAPIIKQAYLSDGTLTVTIELSVWGAFSQLILPPEIKPIESIKPVNPLSKEKINPSDDNPWTGLIVDARGLELNPALIPSIVDDSGAKVYGSEFINRDYAVRWGMCIYASGTNSINLNERVGLNPLVVKCIRSAGPMRTDLVISNDDASRIRSSADHVRLLREGRVVVIIDTAKN